MFVRWVSQSKRFQLKNKALYETVKTGELIKSFNVKFQTRHLEGKRTALKNSTIHIKSKGLAQRPRAQQGDRQNKQQVERSVLQYDRPGTVSKETSRGL